jgi:hypothetical protein
MCCYSSTNPAFPHDLTANQWFDEAHFENYRAMGEATGRAAFAKIQTEVEKLLLWNPDRSDSPDPLAAFPSTSPARRGEESC